MNARQNAHLKMYSALIATVDANTPVWTGFAPFADSYGEFLAVHDGIYELMAQQIGTSKGFTHDKSRLREELSEELFRLSGILCIYSRVANRPEIALDAKVNMSALTRMSEMGLSGFAQLLLTLAESLDASALTPLGLKPTQIADARSKLSAFTAAIGTPKSKRREAAEATRDLASTIDQLQEILRDRLDLAANVMQQDHPDFYTLYKFARKIIDPGFRSRALTVKVTDKATGKPLPGVSALIMPGEKTKETGNGGGFYMKTLPEDAYTLSLMKEGYQQEVVTFRIVGKQPKTLAVEMSR